MVNKSSVDINSRTAADLENDLRDILENTYDLILPDDSWISSGTLLDIVYCSEAALQDMRHKYPHHLSVIKHIAIVTFWIIKLKPIHNVNLLKKSTGEVFNFIEVNEAVAIFWAMKVLKEAVQAGVLSELISSKEENIEALDQVITYYYNNGFYRNKSTLLPIPQSKKIYETLNNFRYRNFTAISIYEILTHLIIPFRVVNKKSV